MDTMITTYNTAVTDAASEILGKERRRKKPWVTKDVLDLCDERRDLKKKRYEAEGAKEYREANRVTPCASLHVSLGASLHCLTKLLQLWQLQINNNNKKKVSQFSESRRFVSFYA